MDAILQLLNSLWLFALEHSEIFIFIATGSLGFLGWLFSKILRSLKHPSAKPVFADTFPFEVIPPNSDQVVRTILGSSQDLADPLADFNIPYQSRLQDHNVQQTLEQQLEQNGWLLVLGQKGLGKTREVAELAQVLNHEGWTVLKLKNHECPL